MPTLGQVVHSVSKYSLSSCQQLGHSSEKCLSSWKFQCRGKTQLSMHYVRETGASALQIGENRVQGLGSSVVSLRKLCVKPRGGPKAAECLLNLISSKETSVRQRDLYETLDKVSSFFSMTTTRRNKAPILSQPRS